MKRLNQKVTNETLKKCTLPEMRKLVKYLSIVPQYPHINKKVAAVRQAMSIIKERLNEESNI